LPCGGLHQLANRGAHTSTLVRGRVSTLFNPRGVKGGRAAAMGVGGIGCRAVNPSDFFKSQPDEVWGGTHEVFDVELITWS
jgi:hypothetical protein